jgi:hypothetical protein
MYDVEIEVSFFWFTLVWGDGWWGCASLSILEMERSYVSQLWDSGLKLLFRERCQNENDGIAITFIYVFSRVAICHTVVDKLTS